MELYEIVIRPEGPFGTPIRGDTLFGQFCWQVAYDPSLAQGGLSSNIEHYKERPFVVFSSAFPRFETKTGKVVYAFKRPSLPLSWLFPTGGRLPAEAMRVRKLNKRRKWMLMEQDLMLDLTKARFASDEELLNDILDQVFEGQHMLKSSHLSLRCSRVHNTIHRITGTTSKGAFGPYNQEIDFYLPGISLVVFVLIDRNVTNIEAVKEGLQRIGRTGFGMDASIGMGRFSVQRSKQIKLPLSTDCNAIYCLAPSVPVQGSYRHAYFTPFVRFGKHGDAFARLTNPFKNPVIMADEGAVFFPKSPEAFARPYWGRCVNNVSLSIPTTVVQGYATWLPIRVDVRGET